MANKIKRSLENTIGKRTTSWEENVLSNVSEGVMRMLAPGRNPGRYSSGEPRHSAAQATFLLPRAIQEKKFLEYGYIKGKEGDYGLVKKAVGDKKYPIYQTAPDATNREKLQVIDNISNAWLGDKKSSLKHPGSFPSAIYTDANGNLFQKAWDLNDYGGEGGSTSGIIGKIADSIGSPTVVTTGFQPVTHGVFKGNFNEGKPSTIKHALDADDKFLSPILNNFLESKGLHYYPSANKQDSFIGLPEVIITGKRNKHKDGGIHIAPSKRGTFTAAATKHGMGVQEFASRVLRNKENYSPAMVKKANFARNASKWNN